VQNKTNKHTCTKLGAEHDLIIHKNNTREDDQPMVTHQGLHFLKEIKTIP
jgi:hypothetical protein